MDKKQKRQFKGFQRKVRKRYPNAKIQMNTNGKFYISSGVGTVVGEELFIPPQTKVFDAWYWASSLKKKQKKVVKVVLLISKNYLCNITKTI